MVLQCSDPRNVSGIITLEGLHYINGDETRLWCGTLFHHYFGSSLFLEAVMVCLTNLADVYVISENF